VFDPVGDRLSRLYMSQEVREIHPNTPPRDGAAKHSALVKLLFLLSKLRARFQATYSQIASSRSEQIDALYEMLWDRIVRAMGRAVVNHETNNWPKYFDGLREVTRKVVGEGTITGLSKIEKAELTRRLTESIDELEHELSKELTKPIETSLVRLPAKHSPSVTKIRR
jgi:hypothetical protein